MKVKILILRSEVPNNDPRGWAEIQSTIEDITGLTAYVADANIDMELVNDAIEDQKLSLGRDK